METLIKDVRYSIHTLAKDRGFTAAALVTLALCIGANSAIFSVVNSVILRPLPFAEPDQLVVLYNSYPNAGAPRAGSGVPDYYDRLAGTDAFAELAMIQARGYTVGERGAPERLVGAAVTPSWFRLLRVPAARGRWFTEEEGQFGNHRKVILSYGYWQEHFGGRADAIGSSLRIQGEPHEVVGVMPAGFRFRVNDARLWTALAFTAEERADDRRHSNNHEMIGRLKPGVTLEQAQAQIDALNARNDERFPQFREILKNAQFHTLVANYQIDLVRDVQSTLLFLQAGVLLVLLIGCVNIANLLLVRSTGRARELATRAALGAGRGRLVRQLMTESLVLAGIGGLLGLFLGWTGVRVFARAAVDLVPRGSEVAMAGSVVVATLGLSIIAGLFFGTIPVVRVLRGSLTSVFREQGRTGTASRKALAVRGGLVVAQVSTAFALLIAAGLMIASFMRTLQVETGFAAENLITASVALSPTRYTNAEQRTAAQEQILARVRAIPGVAAAGATDVLPFTSDRNSSAFSPADYVPQPGESVYAPINSAVSPGYFEAMGIELVHGRWFDHTDTRQSQRVFVIDEWLANRYWPGQDPIGKQAFEGVRGIGLDDDIELRTIVGVVKNVRVAGYNGDQPNGHFYYAAPQRSIARFYVVIRTRVEPTTIVGGLRAAVTGYDPDLPVYDVQTMKERMADSLAADRLRLFLVIGFAFIALFLSAVGLYGVLAYTVTQRTSEMGIRMALGSSTREIFRLVLIHGLRLTATGLGIGLAASLALSRLIRGLLFNVQPNDPLVFVSVLVVLAVTAALACLLPARRATRIDPIVALKEA